MCVGSCVQPVVVPSRSRGCTSRHARVPPLALARLQDAGIYDAEVHAALFQLGIVRPLACVDAVFARSS